VSDVNTTLLAQAAAGLDGVIDKTNPQSPSHLYGVTVQYEDIDAGGIVYHATYLNFAERARSALLRACNFDVQTWLRDYRQGFVITHIETDYFSPAHLHDALYVQTSCLHLGGASTILQQDVNSMKTGLNFARVIVKAAWIDIDQGPRKFPEPLQAVLRSFQSLSL
jgi:acyl-CoA thioester hydrolase